ncbi:hypothetical protein ACIGKL_15880 [Pseudomonas sp. NPDC077186]|uniref:hypothetical protein n=1 Tax=Pseudomonas sp. NPDC077186 TaxID=3364421 RepID=UPI0037C961FC
MATRVKLERETRLEPSLQPFDLKGFSAITALAADAIMDLFDEPGNPCQQFFF